MCPCQVFTKIRDIPNKFLESLSSSINSYLHIEYQNIEYFVKYHDADITIRTNLFVISLTFITYNKAIFIYNSHL